MHFRRSRQGQSRHMTIGAGLSKTAARYAIPTHEKAMSSTIMPKSHFSALLRYRKASSYHQMAIRLRSLPLPSVLPALTACHDPGSGRALLPFAAFFV